MSKKQSIITIGVIVALLPMLGFPRAWEAFFQIVAGLSIVGLSVWSGIDRKLKLKAKAQMRQARSTASVASEASELQEADQASVVPKVPPETPTYGKRVTDFYPKTGQAGRRVSDLKRIEPTEPEEPLI